MIYLGSEGDLQRAGELSVMTLTNSVRTLLMRVGGGRLARHRQAVVVEVDSDVLGFEAGQLERCGHGVGIVGFVEIQSRKVK